MKAMTHATYGPPSVLRLEDIPRPVPGSGEVLVRIEAAGVDPGVWHLMAGMPYLIRAMGFGLRAPKDRVRGQDLAGRVEAVGPDVTRFAPGDEVYGTCDGSFAEYACAKEENLARKPANLTFEEAAAVPVSAVTALQAVRNAGRLKAGQSVLVIGAGGGTGHFAVQLAKSFGAHVTGVCSTAKADLVRSLGADEVIDYTREDATDGTRRYDLVLDTAGNRPLPVLRRALTPGGTLVIVGGEGGGDWIGGNGRQLRALVLSPFTGQRLRGLAVMNLHHDDLSFLAELIEGGTVRPVVDRTYPLADVPEAITYLMDGHVRGKVVVRI
ncbi:NADPH:quinone reductase [Streptomyces agglomeratus]|uniref:NAD(P)-dependent alcohol dehydrogenase n=1 Tax=Streptomyces agglomeratus TaxID=285458 RepID=UPI00085425A3|nr:NAD(P)-dependent alcohol dehydrogenase [Streptomyces agglomeratus]OEJ41704.1 NADPH:quinone reductase [Streptomyces agglomeratus]OEJ43918.1 NADPH:quinone reductase [Streptomyces agglomeratus]OEJ61568.1 NADPH:quinone reductase [Streptomyces agglomeratus]